MPQLRLSRSLVKRKERITVTLLEFCRMTRLHNGKKMPVCMLYANKDGKTLKVGYFSPLTYAWKNHMPDEITPYLNRKIIAFPSNLSTFGVEVGPC